MIWFKSIVGSWKRDANWIFKIHVMIQGVDLRRFNKPKWRVTLGMAEYPPVIERTLFAVHKAFKYGWVSIPYHLVLYTNGIAE